MRSSVKSKRADNHGRVDQQAYGEKQYAKSKEINEAERRLTASSAFHLDVGSRFRNDGFVVAANDNDFYVLGERCVVFFLSCHVRGEERTGWNES